MQDLLLQKFPVTKDENQDPQENVCDTRDYMVNNIYQQTTLKNDKTPAVVQSMLSTTSVINDESSQSKNHLYQQAQDVYQKPQHERAITPPSIMYMVPNYVYGSAPFHTQLIPYGNYKKGTVISKSDRCSQEDDVIDVVNDSLDKSSNADTSKDTDNLSIHSSSSSPPICETSISSSPSGSETNISPRSSGTSTPDSIDSSKKKSRTNYSPEQVQALEKVFHEQPYPDSEMMEKLSKDIDIPEGKIKVWFQNKRARWRRRVQGNTNNHAFYPFMSPTMSPMAPYGFMAPNPMFAVNSHPAPMLSGFPMSPGAPVTSTPGHQQQQQIKSPYHGQIPPFPFYTYPYGMFPQYYRS